MGTEGDAAVGDMPEHVPNKPAVPPSREHQDGLPWKGRQGFYWEKKVVLPLGHNRDWEWGMMGKAHCEVQSLQ